MQHTSHSGCARFPEELPGIVFGIPRMYDNGPGHFFRELELSGERRALQFAGRVVVMIVEAALPYGDCACAKKFTQLWDVASGIERRRIVRVYARRGEDKTRVLHRDRRGDRRRVERLPDADNRRRAR